MMFVDYIVLFKKLEAGFMARRARFSDFDGVITEEMLSDRQRAILDFIREHVFAKGYPPARA